MPPIKKPETRSGSVDDLSVFINCPFDEAYRPMLEAIVFTILENGYVPRSALEIDDAGENRLDKIVRLIGECRVGVHDLSRVEPDSGSGLPRFNMPFELGIFHGAARFGDAVQRRKRSLILEREPFEGKRYISDLSGHDFKAHQGDVKLAVTRVRDHLNSDRRNPPTGERRGKAPANLTPGGDAVFRRFREFERDLDDFCRDYEHDRAVFVLNQFKEYTGYVSQWIRDHEWSPSAPG